MSDKIQNLKFVFIGEDKSASKTSESIADHGQRMVGRVGSAFGKLGGMIGGEFGEITEKVQQGFEKLEEAGHEKIGAKLTAIGAGVAGLGMAFSMMGSKEKTAMASLDQAIENSGHTAADYKEEIEKSIKTQEDYGHSSTDTAAALQRLTEATNDPKLALEQLGMVSDLAASRHTNLATAADMVAKVYGGSTKILKNYGITVENVKQAEGALTTANKNHESAVTSLSKAKQRLADLEAVDAGTTKLSVSQQIALRDAHLAVAQAEEKVKASSEAQVEAQKKVQEVAHATKDSLEQLAQKVHGQAAVSVDSFSGRLEVLKTRLGDWAAKTGTEVGPTLTKIGPALMGVGAVIESGFVPKLGKATLVAAKFGGELVGSAAVAVWDFTTALAATAVEAAVAFGAMVAEAAVWAADMVVAGATALLPFLPFIIAIGAVAFAGYELVKHWHTIWGDIKAVGIDAWHFAEDLFNNKITQTIIAVAMPMLWIALHWRQVWADVRGVGETAIGWVAGLPGRIGRAVVGLFDGFKTAFRGAIDWVISAWNGLRFSIHVPHIPGTNIGGNIGFGVPRIPMLAAGGIVPATPGGRLVRVAEAGQAEAIIPLNKAHSVLGSGSTVINLHLTTLYGNADAAAREILAALQRLKGNGVQLNLAN